jgi:cytoskeletal protein CcmA (bactofilin family)
MEKKDLTGIGELRALLGRGTQFEGKLFFEGRVRIDGEFKGEIFSDGVLIVGEEAKLSATIEVGTLIVRGGSVTGNVKALQLVEAYAPGKIYGNITAPQLFLDKGVIFKGTSVMLEEDNTEGSADNSAKDGQS